MRTRLLIAALLLILSAGIASAEEIIFFTNGTSMPVAGHSIEGEMIRADLGDDGWLGFPRAQVERIEVAGREVFPNDSGPANRMVEESGERSYGVRGRRPGRHDRRSPGVAAADADPAIGTDPNGIPVYRPFIDSRNSALQQVGATGHEAVAAGGADAKGGPTNAPRQTHQIGGPQRYVKESPSGGKPKVTGMTRARRGSERPAGGSGGTSSSGDDN